MPLSNVNTNINNVSMDYFLRGVEAAKPQGAQPGALAPEGANELVAQEPQGAGKLVAQLDMLLVKSAKASTQSLDGKTVKQTLQKLVDDGALDRDSLKLLAKAADNAAKSLKSLDKFTGRQLAEAFGADGMIDATTKSGKAIFAAVTAQQELSDLLAQLGKNLDSISRHDAEMRAVNPQYKGVDAALRDEVDDFRLLCDRRATEINHLAYQMKDFAVHLAANGQNADPNVVAILKAKADELLPRQALAMHGTADALATVSEEGSGKLRPLAEKIDAFKRNPSATLDSQGYQALQSDIRTMKAAVADIRKNGIEVGGGRMMVAKDILNALETEVAKAEQLFETARKEVKRTVLANYLGTATKLFCEDDPYEFQRSFGNKQLTTMLRLRDKMLLAMDALATAALDPTKAGKDDLEPLIIALRTAATKLWKAADNTEHELGQTGERINVIIDLVINHSSSKHEWFRKALDELKEGKTDGYAQYYHFEKGNNIDGWSKANVDDWYYESNFVSEMPDLNLKNPELREELKKITKYWLDMGVDGFRLDAVLWFESVDGKYGQHDNDSSIEDLKWLYDYAKSVKEDVYMVGECWTDSTTIAEYYKSGVDSFFNFKGQGSKGSFNLSINGSDAAGFVSFLESWQGQLLKNNPNAIDAKFLSNHDTVRSAEFITNDTKKRLAAAMYILAPGNPFIYYGEEIEMDGVNPPDPDVRRGMLWSTTDADGYVKKIPGGTKMEDEPTISVESSLKNDQSLMSFYKRAIVLRNQNPEIARGTIKALTFEDKKETAGFISTYKDSSVLVMYNLGETSATVNIPSSDFKVNEMRGYILAHNANDALYRETPYDDSIKLDGQTLTMPAHSVFVLK